MADLPTDLLQGIIRAGLSDELLGRAVRELMSKSSVAARAPGLTTGSSTGELSSPPLTPTAVTPPSAQVARAIEKTTPRTDPNQPVPLKVRFPNGAATNVLVPFGLLESLSQKLGGEDSARAWLRTQALEAPESVSNRSRWVQDRAQARLAQST